MSEIDIYYYVDNGVIGGLYVIFGVLSILQLAVEWKVKAKEKEEKLLQRMSSGRSGATYTYTKGGRILRVGRLQFLLHRLCLSVCVIQLARYIDPYAAYGIYPPEVVRCYAHNITIIILAGASATFMMPIELVFQVSFREKSPKLHKYAMFVCMVILALAANASILAEAIYGRRLWILGAALLCFAFTNVFIYVCFCIGMHRLRQHVTSLRSSRLDTKDINVSCPNTPRSGRSRRNSKRQSFSVHDTTGPAKTCGAAGHQPFAGKDEQPVSVILSVQVSSASPPVNPTENMITDTLNASNSIGTFKARSGVDVPDQTEPSDATGPPPLPVFVIPVDPAEQPCFDSAVMPPNTVPLPVPVPVPSLPAFAFHNPIQDHSTPPSSQATDTVTVTVPSEPPYQSGVPVSGPASDGSTSSPNALIPSSSQTPSHANGDNSATDPASDTSATRSSAPLNPTAIEYSGSTVDPKERSLSKSYSLNTFNRLATAHDSLRRPLHQMTVFQILAGIAITISTAVEVYAGIEYVMAPTNKDDRIFQPDHYEFTEHTVFILLQLFCVLIGFWYSYMPISALWTHHISYRRFIAGAVKPSRGPSPKGQHRPGLLYGTAKPTGSNVENNADADWKRHSYKVSQTFTEDELVELQVVQVPQPSSTRNSQLEAFPETTVEDAKKTDNNLDNNT